MKRKQHRGFAAMDPAKLHEIAVKGGSSVPEEKRSFYKDRSLAKSAGAKGGRAGAKKKSNG